MTIIITPAMSYVVECANEPPEYEFICISDSTKLPKEGEPWPREIKRPRKEVVLGSMMLINGGGIWNG